MSILSLARIKTLREMLEYEGMDILELSEIDSAYKEMVEKGYPLRDLPENATVEDQLEELEDIVSPLERLVYDYILENYGESEANDPCYETGLLVNYIEEHFICTPRKTTN